MAGTGEFMVAWLKSLPWEKVEALNARLCREGRDQHGRTSEGYEPGMQIWEKTRARGELPFAEVLRLGKTCHRMAHFLFYNGDTFAAIIRVLCDRLPLDAFKRAQVRQLAGHMVAGTLPPEAEKQLLDFLSGSSLPS